jgi:copper chaperone CopZ
MKRMLFVAWIALGAAMAPGCKSTETAATTPAETKKATLAIEGTTCGGCAMHIEEALRKVAGVVEAKASHEEARAWITYDPAQISVEGLIKAIEEAGYKARIAEDKPGEAPAPTPKKES